MNLFLTFLPIIMEAIFIIFAAILILDHEKRLKTKSNHKD